MSIFQNANKLRTLIELCVEANLPENQIREYRFFHLILLFLLNTKIDCSLGNADWDACKAIIENHDAQFGTEFVLREIDYPPIPYITWVVFENSIFRVQSGTYHAAELYLNSIIAKLLSLDDFVEEQIDASCSEIISFFLPRIDSFLNESGLVEFESIDISDANSCKATAIDKDRVYRAFVKYLCINRSEISNAECQTLEKLANIFNVTNIDPLRMEELDLSSVILVKVEDFFILPLISQFFPALLKQCAHLISWKENDAAQLRLKLYLLQILHHNLQNKFGIKSIFVRPQLSEDLLSEMLIFFENKAIFINLLLYTNLTKYSDISDKTLNTLTLWNKLGESTNHELQVHGGRVGIPNVKLIEPVLISVVDGVEERVSITADEEMFPPDAVHVCFDVQSLSYILCECKDANEFLKFVRSLCKLRTREVRFFGSDNLDLFAEFIRTGGFGPRGRFPIATAIMLNPYEFSERYYQQLCEHREKNSLVRSKFGSDEYERVFPAVLRGQIDAGRRHYKIAVSNFQIDMYTKIQSPSLQIIHQLWFTTTQALAFHFGEMAENLASFLVPRHISRIIVEDVAIVSDTQTKVSVFRQKSNLIVKFQVSTEIKQKFLSGTNDAEVTLVNSCLQEIEKELALDLSTLHLTCQSTSDFRIQELKVEHESALVNYEPVPIYKSDVWSVNEKEAESLFSNSVTEGLYEEKGILEKLVHPRNALINWLDELVSSFDSDRLIKRAYVELESAHIYYFKLTSNLALNTLTSKSIQQTQEYAEKHNEGTSLRFALRMLLETAVRKSQKDGRAASSEEFSLMLAICDRLAQLDFLGDSVCFLTRLRPQPLNLVINEWGNLWIEGTSDYVGLPQHKMLKDHLEYMYEKPDLGANSEDIRSQLIVYFDDAFKHEFGYLLSEKLQAYEVLLIAFDSTAEPFIIASKAALCADLVEKGKLSKSVAKLVLKDLELFSASMVNVKTIAPSEHYWREERLLNKPLVCLPNGTDVIFGINVVDWASRIFLQRIIACRFDERKIKTQAFRNAIAAWTDMRGEEFRQRCCSLMERHGWICHAEVSSLCNEAIPKRDIGPIDIIATHSTSKRIFVVECKRNSFSRSPKDLETELRKFFGRHKEIGHVRRLLNKVDWVRSKRNLLGKEYSLNEINSWSVEAVFVSSEYIWSIDAKQPEGLAAYTYREFEEYLASGMPL